MKKLVIPLIILAIIFAICRFMPEKPIGTVIINMDKFPKLSQRSEIRDCLEGKRGIFTQPVENFCGKVEMLKILGSLKKFVYFAEFRFFAKRA